MVIGFYLGVMNFRGVVNSTFLYALYNEKILKNKSIVFYDPSNKFNESEVVQKFKKKFKLVGVSQFKEIDELKNKYNLECIIVQKSGKKDLYYSKKIKTIIHAVYPQKLREIHGDRYAYISNWLSHKFSNSKVPAVPYIVQLDKTKQNLKKKLRIKSNQIVFGCHGGESSFDLKFVHNALIDVVNKRKDIVFLFLNINKFCNHPRIKFLKGTSDEVEKKKFINTCDAMIYGRSLGESFGLACAEFAVIDKPIISYKFNRHRSHENSISKEFFFEYDSYKSLQQIILNFKKIYKKKSFNEYKKCEPKNIMKLFEKFFLKDYKPPRITTLDYLNNYHNHFVMNYLYIRHKIYNHYHDMIETRFLGRK
tara:strand:+ start:3518 stop:4612 length:1095 start_codon:yes stop_codon:yes gene_type:complete